MFHFSGQWPATEKETLFQSPFSFNNLGFFQVRERERSRYSEREWGDREKQTEKGSLHKQISKFTSHAPGTTLHVQETAVSKTQGADTEKFYKTILGFLLHGLHCAKLCAFSSKPQRNGAEIEVGGKDGTALKTEIEVEMEKVYAKLSRFCPAYRIQFSTFIHSESTLESDGFPETSAK